MASPRKSFVAAPSTEGELGKHLTPSSSSIEQKSSSMVVRTNTRAPIRKARVASASFSAMYILTVVLLVLLLPQPASTFSLQLQTASSPPPLSSSSPPPPKKQNPPPSSSTYLSSLEPDTPSYSDQIAVVLNVNARSVTQSSVDAAESIVGASNVFVTTTEEESDEAARIIVRRGYGTVVPAGGDGTLCSVINSIVDARRRQRRRASLDGVAVNGDGGEAAAGKRKLPLPRFAFLPLGTGNGMGMLVGPRGRGRKQKKVVNMLTRLKEMVELASTDGDVDDGVPPVPVPTLKCPMIEILTEDDLLYPEKRKGGGSSSVNVTNGTTSRKAREVGLGGGGVHGELCFFAGAGFDSLMLSDFNKVKRWSSTKPGPIRRVLGSVAGYTVALLVRTLPQCLVWGRHKLKVRVTVPRPSATDGERATTYWMDPRRGDTAMEVTPPLQSQLPKPGESVFPTDVGDDRQLLFEGETGIVAAGTTPYYGGGLKLFPFSRVQPHGMHLRLGRINPFLGFINIPWIFRGTYRHYNMGCLDFVGPDFDVEVSEPYPFQHSGEAAEENIARFRLRVAEEEVEFVDFLRPRLIVGY